MSTSSHRRPTSYQVLDAATGRRTNQFRLLEKAEFRRSPWICRIFHSFRRRSTKKVSFSDVQEHVFSSLKDIKEKEDPTYEDCLQPFFAVIEDHFDDDSQRTLLELFHRLLTLTIECSAEFLQHAQQTETELGPREHYRALTNYWVYLIAGTIFHDADEIQPLCLRVYAYSFIYPYSDDLLDMVEADPYQKKKFCENIASKIIGRTPEQLAFENCGEKVERNEWRVYELMDKVLVATKSRALREAFCAINHAQLASVQQQVDFDDMRAGAKSLTKEFQKRIFDISVNKGVAAVMPDAHFHFPETLTKEQAELMAMIGAMGQFVNDIEGLFRDLEAKSLTPALISFLKHGTLDRFVEKSLTQIKVQMLRAPSQYPSLSQDRVQLLFHVIKLRLLIAAALLHENTQGGVLSAKFVRGLEEHLGLSLSVLALLGRLEQETFGNFVQKDSMNSQHAVAHQLSSPEHFRSFIINKAEESMQEHWRDFERSATPLELP